MRTSGLMVGVMRTRLRSMVLLLALVGGGGCYSTTIHTAPPGTPVGETHRVGATHFVGGVTSAEIDGTAPRICPDGVASVRTWVSFGDWLLGWITFDIYTPNHVEVTCVRQAAAPPAAPSTPPVAPTSE
jgi:hypothetical protein